MSVGFREEAIALVRRGERRNWSRLRSSPAAVLVAVLVLFGVLLMRPWHPSILAGWAPQSASTALLTMWQVQVTLAAIAFGALALIFQLAPDPSVATRSAREVLLDETKFRQILSLVSLGSVVLGAASIWGAGDPATLLLFLTVFVGTVWGLTYSFVKTMELYRDPQRADRASTQLLKRRLERSIQGLLEVKLANKGLQEFAKQRPAFLLDVHPFPQRDDLELLKHRTDLRLVDVYGTQLDEALVEIAEAFALQTSPVPDRPIALANKPTLCLLLQIDGVLRAGQPLFRLSPGATVGRRETQAWSRRLSAAVRLTDV